MDWLRRSQPGKTLPIINDRLDSGVLGSAVALEGGSNRDSLSPQQQQQRQKRDDAPMTPVVYVVLWTSVAVGCLRGYALNSSIAARVAPSYTYTFSGHHQAEILRRDSPYCTTGVDGLPGLSWYESIIYIIPPVVAPLLGAIYVRHCGRRSGIMLGCVAMIIGQILLASARVLVQLYIGQALVVAASDVLFLSVALQDLEIAPRTSRGFFLLVHILGFAFGCCSVAVVGYFVSNQNDLGWRLLFAMGTLPALAVMMVTPWLFETPHSLIERGKYAKGWEALREIRGPFYDTTYDEFMGIVRAAAVAPKGLRMYLELFSKRAYFPAICVGVSIAILVALLDPLSRSYVVYQTLTRSGIAYNSAVLMSSLTLFGSYAVGVLLSVFLVDRLGRLPLLRVSSALAVVVVTVLVAMSATFASLQHISLDDPAISRIPARWPLYQLATLAVLAAGNGIAWSSAAWVVIFESQALAVRPAAVAVCIAATNFAASVLEAKLLCYMKVKYYVLVLFVSVFAMIIAFGFVPETGRVSLEDISALYGKHWFWRRILIPKERTQKKPKAQQLGGSGLGKGKPSPAHSSSHPSTSSGGGGDAAPSSQTPPPHAACRSDQPAAPADTAPAADAGTKGGGGGGGGSKGAASPFGLSTIQATRPVSGCTDSPEEAAQEPSTAAAAEAAAAASIALAGAASRAASSAHSSQALLQHGRSVRKSLRLAGRRRSAQVPEVMSADAVDQLADELMSDD